MSIVGRGTETYLYVNGIVPNHELHLTDNIVLLPVSKTLPLNTVSNLLKHDVDFAISVLCAQSIASQLKITANDAESLAITAWNAQWDCILLGALFNCDIMCNIQCDKNIEEIINATAQMNITNYEMHALFSEPHYLTEYDETWIAKNYSRARALLDNNTYCTAIHSMATYHWHTMPRVQLAIIWAGIEALFDVGTELSFRISLYVANFLSDNNSSAKELFSRIKKLYNARSAAVHGGKIKGKENELVEQSAELLNRLIRKCAEKNTLPDIETLVFS